jgi:hypothetical protein
VHPIVDKLLERYDREPPGLLLMEREWLVSEAVPASVRRKMQPSRRRLGAWIGNGVVVELFRFWLSLRRERVTDGLPASVMRREVSAALRRRREETRPRRVDPGTLAEIRAREVDFPVYSELRDSVMDGWESDVEIRVGRVSIPLGRPAQLHHDYHAFKRELGPCFTLDADGEFADQSPETIGQRERKVSDWRRDRKERAARRNKAPAAG